jgi:hypothetical protein
MSLFVDGVAVVSGRSLADATPPPDLWFVSISASAASGAFVDFSGMLSPPVGKVISLRKDTGNTLNQITFNYEIWEKI